MKQKLLAPLQACMSSLCINHCRLPKQNLRETRPNRLEDPCGKPKNARR